MSKALDEIRKILRARRVLYGENETTVPYLKIYRYNTENVPMPKIENPYLYFIIDGSIRLYTPSGIMDYISGAIFGVGDRYAAVRSDPDVFRRGRFSGFVGRIYIKRRDLRSSGY